MDEQVNKKRKLNNNGEFSTLIFKCHICEELCYNIFKNLFAYCSLDCLEIMLYRYYR
jgi:hypothetical protein